MLCPSVLIWDYLSLLLSNQTLIDQSVIIQVVIYNRSLSLGGHLKTSLLAKGGEGIVDVQLAPLHRGPQGAKAWWCPGDVDVVVVVWRWVWVRVGGDGWLLLLGRRSAARSPGPRGDSTGGGRHLVVCSATQTKIKKGVIARCWMSCSFYVQSTFWHVTIRTNNDTTQVEVCTTNTNG